MNVRYFDIFSDLESLSCPYNNYEKLESFPVRGGWFAIESTRNNCCKLSALAYLCLWPFPA